MVIDYIVTELTEGKKTYDENGSMAKKRSNKQAHA